MAYRARKRTLVDNTGQDGPFPRPETLASTKAQLVLTLDSNEYPDAVLRVSGCRIDEDDAACPLLFRR